MNIQNSESHTKTPLQKAGIASVRFFFINGQSEALKIVANPDGITALIDELREAQTAIENGRSHLPGDRKWMRGDVKVVAIEPEHYTLPVYSDAQEAQISRRNIVSRILFIFFFALISFLVVMGVLALFYIL